MKKPKVEERIPHAGEDPHPFEFVRDSVGARHVRSFVAEDDRCDEHEDVHQEIGLCA